MFLKIVFLDYDNQFGRRQGPTSCQLGSLPSREWLPRKTILCVLNSDNIIIITLTLRSLSWMDQLGHVIKYEPIRDKFK